MARGKKSVKAALAERLAARSPGPLEEAEFEEIRRRFPSSSSKYLRKLVRDSGVDLAPLVEGVRQESFDQLERTLLALEAVYSLARVSGDVARQKACRRLVIEAKDHARWSQRRPAVTEEGRREKQEMIDWMLVWLENPAIFPEWVKLRRKGASAP